MIVRNIFQFPATHSALVALRIHPLPGRLALAGGVSCPAESHGGRSGAAALHGMDTRARQENRNQLKVLSQFLGLWDPFQTPVSWLINGGRYTFLHSKNLLGCPAGSLYMD